MRDIGNVMGKVRRGNIVVGNKAISRHWLMRQSAVFGYHGMGLISTCKGTKVKFAYAIPGIRPKEFKTIKSEEELKAFLSSRNKSELYVTLDSQAKVRRSRNIPRRN